MISQKCPVCHSSRIRRGYRPTRFWSKLLFRFNLLCDNCNWEFVGFALPGFLSTKQTKSSREKKERGKNVQPGTSQLQKVEEQKGAEIGFSEKSGPKVKKKIRIRI